MRNKATLILLGFAALGGLGYLINRLSTQFHPYGNWFIVAIVIVIVAIGGAWVWNEIDKEGTT